MPRYWITYECSICRSIYDSVREYKVHLKNNIECKEKSTRIDQDVTPKYWTCEKCGKQNDNKPKHWGHIKRWYNKPSSCIPYCGLSKEKVNSINIKNIIDDENVVLNKYFYGKKYLITEKKTEDLLGKITINCMNKLNKIIKDNNYESPPLQFSSISIQLTNDLSKEHKKDGGIFFTHPTIVKQTIDTVLSYDITISTILEPSCGSCEFITQLNNLYPDISIDGVEFDKHIYDNIKHICSDNITIINEDFLKFTIDKKYDLIIGNPPYFVIKKGNCSKEYHPYLEGRPNIYLLFILKSLSMLSDKGIIAFVLPCNFLNCSYYNKVRQYICDKFTLLNVLDCSNEFLDTDQPTNIIIIQNKISTDSNPYILSMNNSVIFNTIEGITKINNLCKDTTTLDKMGFNVHVGTVVWNQVKETLTCDSSKTRLIYSSDFKDNELVVTVYKDPDKKNYINEKGLTDPLLVVNRGYGKGKYTFNYCLIDIDKPFLIENHVICIKYRDEIKKDNLLQLYNIIIQSFQNPKTKEFIDCYCTNDAINTTELQYTLPIYKI